MSLVKFRSLSPTMLSSATDIFYSLKFDPEGKEKYEKYLRAAKVKLQAVERSLARIAGKGVVDESDFAPILSSVRRALEDCLAGGWEGFNRTGSGNFGQVVNLDVNLRAMTHSLGSHMIYEP